jgi:competence protein CoiA
MLKALVGGEEKLATPKENGVCPSCGSRVVSKCGSKVVWHWAHESLEDCDSWSEGETLWHAAWKSRFAYTEVPLERGGERHRADALSDSNVVIEFQHSALSPKEIDEREMFYDRMVWVLDGAEAFRKKRIGLCTVAPAGSGREYVKFRWKSRRRSFDDATCPIFIDLGFAFSDCGKPFQRPADDGVLRSGDTLWQKAIHDLLLLEVKKRHEGYGWGRLVSHKDFCRRFGAFCFSEYQTSESVRWVPQCWHRDYDGYTYCGECGMDAFDELGNYGWCESQIERARNKGALA